MFGSANLKRPLCSTYCYWLSLNFYFLASVHLLVLFSTCLAGYSFCLFLKRWCSLGFHFCSFTLPNLNTLLGWAYLIWIMPTAPLFHPSKSSMYVDLCACVCTHMHTHAHILVSNSDFSLEFLIHMFNSYYTFPFGYSTGHLTLNMF